MPRRETQQQKNSRPMRDDCFYWCARGACPPCAAAGRGSGAPPALHSLPFPFKSRGSKRKMTARRRSFPFWCARGTCPALRRRPPRVASLPRRLAKRPRVQVPRIVKNSRPRRTTVFTGARGGGTCPPCAAAGRGSGAPPALHSLPLPFKSPDSKKQPSHTRRLFLLVREGGLEPPRPEWTLEPESSESTNSTTRACCQLAYNSIYAQNCQQKNFLFRQFSPAGESLVSAHRMW